MNNDNNIIKHDITLWGTVIIISNIVYCFFKNKIPFDIDWCYYSVASLFGFVIHSLITSNLTVYLIKKFKIKNHNIKLALSDIIKWTTVYIITNIIILYINNDEIIFDKIIFKLYSGIILGYVIFDLLIEKDIADLSKNNQNFIIDIFKTAVAMFLGYFISDGYIHTDFIHILTSVEVGLIIFYVIIHKLLPSLLL